MKKLIVLLIVIVAVVILFAGCSNTLTANIVESDKADQTVVELEENPTTGYAWTYEISDESVLKLLSDQFIDNSDKDTVGSGGIHEFVFQALKDGKADVTFKYERSFEKDSAESVIVYKYDISNKVPVLVNIEKEGE